MALRKQSPVSVEEAIRKLSASVMREIHDAAERAHSVVNQEIRLET